jgi:FkbM family methyltransferase
MTLSERATLARLLADQDAVLHDPRITSVPNRQGRRQSTGTILAAAFVNLCEALDPHRSVEIGAHEASFSEALKGRLPELIAIAFEANPLVYAAHAKRLRAIGVDYRHCAITHSAGPVELQVPVSLLGRALDRVSEIGSLARRTLDVFEYEALTAPGAALDEVIACRTGERTVAWIDAEGAQKEIIDGGRNFFGQVLAIYVELEREVVWQGQLCDLEIETELEKYALAPAMRDNLASGQYNAVFVRDVPDVLAQALAVADCYAADLQRLLNT